MGDNLSPADRALFDLLLKMPDRNKGSAALDGPMTRSRRQRTSADQGPSSALGSKRNLSSDRAEPKRQRVTSPSSSQQALPPTLSPHQTADLVDGRSDFTPAEDSSQAVASGSSCSALRRSSRINDLKTVTVSSGPALQAQQQAEAPKQCSTNPSPKYWKIFKRRSTTKSATQMVQEVSDQLVTGSIERETARAAKDTSLTDDIIPAEPLNLQPSTACVETVSAISPTISQPCLATPSDKMDMTSIESVQTAVPNITDINNVEPDSPNSQPDDSSPTTDPDPVFSTAQTTPDSTIDLTTCTSPDEPESTACRELSLDDLFKLSKALTRRTPFDRLPEPTGEPPVWAMGRQALCETLPYYRAYQSAGYCSGGVAFAYYFDKECNERDYIDSNVVIARAGGGMLKDLQTDSMVMRTDQKENSQVTSLRRNKDLMHPVAIIVGDRNPKAPCRMPHAFCLLDWFKATHIWPEKENGKTFFRFRFEKLKPDKTSWWKGKDVEEPVQLGELPQPYSAECENCKQLSDQVYIQGWMCLESNCSSFWRFADGTQPDGGRLSYDPRFLKQYTHWPHPSEPQPLAPALMQQHENASHGYNRSSRAWKGFVCPQCKGCSSREEWSAWVCKTPHCGFTYALPEAPIPLQSFQDPLVPKSRGYAYNCNTHSPGLPVTVSCMHNYRIYTYRLPGIDGFIAHLVANQTVNEESGGPDDMWKELQRTDIGLKRRPMPSGKLKGDLLTQHFVVNYGMPYKYVASVESKSFDEACKAITSTRSRLEWAARLVTEESNTSFNELLALGYFENQAIDYHDDGENGLGPTIATLSLGFPAVMKVRMKGKHYYGMSKTGNFVNAVPIPGCEKYQERMDAYVALQGIRNATQRNTMIRNLPGRLGLRKSGRNTGDVMNLDLRHGDIVIMHGEKIQEYYEHAVTPNGNLRFSLTCRNIDLASLPPDLVPNYEVKPDQEGYDGSLLPYVE